MIRWPRAPVSLRLRMRMCDGVWGGSCVGEKNGVVGEGVLSALAWGRNKRDGSGGRGKMGRERKGGEGRELVGMREVAVGKGERVREGVRRGFANLYGRIGNNL